LSLPITGIREQWKRIELDFKGYGAIRGSLRTIARRSISRIPNVIYSMLPLKTEAVVLEDVEILIKIKPYLLERLKPSDRVHEASEGDIIYRPQIPAISIFADYYEIYEPVAKIGIIDRNDFDKLREIAEAAKSVMLVEIKRIQ